MDNAPKRGSARFRTAFSMGAAIFAAALPFGLSAQSAQLSSSPNYHLLQLTVETGKVARGAFETKTEAIRSCGDALQLARELDADVKRDRFIMDHQMPASLRNALRELPTGQATSVFSTDPSLMRVIVLCARG